MRERLYLFLRWSERYTKTDMVYLATNGFWINLNFVFVSVFSFILSIVFANLLTKTEYGTYQYFLSISAIFGAFTFSGFNLAIAQSVARGYEGTLRASISPQLRWNLIPMAAALVWSGHYFLLGQSTLGWGVLVVAISLPIINTYNSYSAYLSGKKDFKRISIYNIAGNAAYYICIFLGVFFVPQAVPLIFINLFITTGASIVWYVRTIHIYNPEGGNDPQALSYARHLSVMNAFSLVASQVDNILVFHFLGAADLALYAIATLLPERLSGAFKAITASALPRFAERDMGEIRKNLGRRLILLLLGTLVCAGLYALISPFLFHLLYPAYDAAVGYSQLYSLVLLNYIGALIITALSAHKKIRALYFLNTAVPIAQVALQVVGIVFWGLWGLVAAKIASIVLLGVASFILIYR